MQDAGAAVVLPDSGAKVFVRPEHYASLTDTLRQDRMRLYTSHVIVAEEFEDAVCQALMSLPSSAQVRGRARDLLPVAWESF